MSKALQSRNENGHNYVKYPLKNIVNINRITSIFYQEFGNNFEFKGESHDFWEIVYADKGELIATADGREVLLHQGDIIFHKPNEFHQLRAHGSIAPNAFIMSFDCRSPAMKYFYRKHMRLNERQKNLIAVILEETAKTFSASSDFVERQEKAILGGQQMIRTCLEQLLILLMRTDAERDFGAKNLSDCRPVQSVTELLEKNINGNLTIDQISAELNYSRSYLCTIFRQKLGCSIMEYYTRLKVKEAKKMLREERFNISQISESLGFCNPHYFSYVFKKHTRMSPREYQKSIQERGVVVTRRIERQ